MYIALQKLYIHLAKMQTRNKESVMDLEYEVGDCSRQHPNSMLECIRDIQKIAILPPQWYNFATDTTDQYRCQRLNQEHRSNLMSHVPVYSSFRSIMGGDCTREGGSFKLPSTTGTIAVCVQCRVFVATGEVSGWSYGMSRKQ